MYGTTTGCTGTATGTKRNRGDRGRTCLPGCFSGLSAVLYEDRGDYLRPLSIALTSSPLLVSPLNSQKNAPLRPWFFT